MQLPKSIISQKLSSNNMKAWVGLSCIALTTLLSACNNDPKLNSVIIVESQFDTGVEKWVADYTGYPDSTVANAAKKDSIMAAKYQFSAIKARMPMLLDSAKYGFKVQSFNKSDSLFTFLKKKVTGLNPGKNYIVSFEIDLGTNYPEKMTGNTTPQGGLVYVKAGAVPAEPLKMFNSARKYYTFNLNKGVRSASGTQMFTLGNIANGLDTLRYKLVARNLDKPISVQANTQGEIWLCVGTDSGYRGLTLLYYDKIKVVITEAN